MDVPVYTNAGEKKGTLPLNDALFGMRWNADLVHQVSESERASARKKVAHVKMRGAVRGGGRKPWRQKGTGRARHGSIRSPLWRKGGVAHGPQSKTVYAKKINKKIAKKAIAAVLSARVRDHALIVLDTLSFPDHKTKRVGELVKIFSKHFPSFGMRGGKALILVPAYDKNAIRAVRNYQGVSLKVAPMAQVRDLLSYRYVMLPVSAVEMLEKAMSKK